MVDEEGSLNGGWNEQNCFTGLRRFLESNNLPTEVDYKYEAFRSDDNPQEMEHIAHVEIEIPGLDRDLFPDGELHGGGEGNSMDAAKNACTLDIVLNLYRSGLLSSFSVAKSEWNEGIIFLPECGNSNDLNKAALTRFFASHPMASIWVEARSGPETDPTIFWYNANSFEVRQSPPISADQLRHEAICLTEIQFAQIMDVLAGVPLVNESEEACPRLFVAGPFGGVTNDEIIAFFIRQAQQLPVVWSEQANLQELRFQLRNPKLGSDRGDFLHNFLISRFAGIKGSLGHGQYADINARLVDYFASQGTLMFENGKVGPLKQRFPIYCCKIDAPTRAINLIPILGAGEQSTNNERGAASSSTPRTSTASNGPNQSQMKSEQRSRTASQSTTSTQRATMSHSNNPSRSHTPIKTENQATGASASEFSSTTRPESQQATDQNGHRPIKTENEHRDGPSPLPIKAEARNPSPPRFQYNQSSHFQTTIDNWMPTPVPDASTSLTSAAGDTPIARASALIDLTADEEIVSSSGTATGQRQQQEIPIVVEDAVALVERRINELLQMGAANRNMRQHREHALMLRTIAGEMSEFLRGLILFGFSHYALLLPENASNANMPHQPQPQQIDEILLREDLNAWFVKANERNLRTFVSVQTLVVSICGDFVRNQIELEQRQQRAKAVPRNDAEIGQQPPNKRARTT